MKKSKKILIGAAACATAAAVCVSGVLIWHHAEKKTDTDGLAYVCPVSDVNTAAAVISDMQFSGVVVPQETKEIKVDTSKTISEVLVQEGDHVDAGAPLFTYDVESMQLELAQGNVEIERMQNEISSSQQQISQLESEKKNASADDQLSYTTQIQSLQTDIAKTQYDIKTKKIELEKLQNTIDHATITSDIAGTVQSLKTTEQLQSEGGDVLMKVMSDGEFRVKCNANEQNVYMLSKDEAMTAHSRINDDTWSGTISEISSEAETSSNNNNMYYGSSDEMTTTSKYPFYVKLDSGEGLMLGQHLLVTPEVGSTVEKSGIWLYQDYVLTDDDGGSYVWAADDKGRLEKRKVTLGESDESMGDCEIASGLSEDDLIAFPADDYQEGMRTTTNADEISQQDDGDIQDGSVYDENGNPVDIGGDGGIYSEDGSVISGGEDSAADGVDPSIDDSYLIDGEDGGAADAAQPEEGGESDGN